MNVETHFIVPEEERDLFIRETILEKLPEDARESEEERVRGIVNGYEGQDVNALSVLAYAAERGRFDEFATKLEEHYQESLQFVHPGARTSKRVPGAVRAERFFLDCYETIGITPN